MLVINPDECIDCGVCEPECPIEAIKPESEENIEWLEINRKYSSQWPNISLKKKPLPEADEFKTKIEKKELLSSKPGSSS